MARPPVGAEFTREQYDALKAQVAEGVQSVRIEGKGEVRYVPLADAIALLDRMQAELAAAEDRPARVLSRRSFYRRN